MAILDFRHFVLNQIGFSLELCNKLFYRSIVFCCVHDQDGFGNHILLRDSSSNFNIIIASLLGNHPHSTLSLFKETCHFWEISHKASFIYSLKQQLVLVFLELVLSRVLF